MKYYDITIKFTLNEKEYYYYDKYIDEALELILPSNVKCGIEEVDYDGED